MRALRSKKTRDHAGTKKKRELDLNRLRRDNHPREKQSNGRQVRYPK